MKSIPFKANQGKKCKIFSKWKAGSPSSAPVRNSATSGIRCFSLRRFPFSRPEAAAGGVASARGTPGGRMASEETTFSARRIASLYLVSAWIAPLRPLSFFSMNRYHPKKPDRGGGWEKSDRSWAISRRLLVWSTRSFGGTQRPPATQSTRAQLKSGPYSSPQ